MSWAEVQEGLLLVYSPLLVWWLIITAVGSILSVLGVIMLEITARMAR